MIPYLLGSIFILRTMIRLTLLTTIMVTTSLWLLLATRAVAAAAAAKPAAAMCLQMILISGRFCTMSTALQSATAEAEEEAAAAAVATHPQHHQAAEAPPPRHQQHRAAAAVAGRHRLRAHVPNQTCQILSYMLTEAKSITTERVMTLLPNVIVETMTESAVLARPAEGHQIISYTCDHLRGDPWAFSSLGCGMVRI